MRVYVGVPDEPRCAGVLVAQHGFGVDGFIQDVVHRLFRRGYVAAAPELFHRQPAGVTDNQTRVAMLNDDEIVADMTATLAHIKALPGCTVGPVGVTGFCMGGRVAYLAAAAMPELAVAGVFYGGNIMKPWGVPRSPLERTAEIRCPILGCFGNDDVNPSPADVDAIAAELTRLGKPHEFHRYSGAGHAFQMFLDGRYRARQARASWGELLAVFAEHLRITQ
jgi:carboxymethylenebutenolidase